MSQARNQSYDGQDLGPDALTEVDGPLSPEDVEREVSGPADPHNFDLEDIDYGLESDEYTLEKMLEEESQRTGADFTSVIDDVVIDDLPENTPAATRHSVEKVPGIDREFEKTELVASPELFEMPEYDQRHAIIHEGVHGLHFNDRLGELNGRVPGEFMNELSTHMVYGGEEGLEGSVELLARYLNPERDRVGDRFRRNEVKKVGEQTDSELVEEIADLKRDLVEQYQEVYDVEIGQGLYMESGEFAGEEYVAVVQGYGAEIEGEDVVKDYLGTETNYPSVQQSYGETEGEYQDLSLKWAGQDGLEEPVEPAGPDEY